MISLNKFTEYLRERLRKDWDIVIAITGEEGCQPANSKVLMADGTWKNIEEIKVGDIVLSPQQDGSYLFSNVLETYQWFSNDNYSIYEKNRQKKLLFTCSYNHLIPMNYRKFPRRKTERKVEWAYWMIKHYQADYLHTLKERTKKNNTIITMPLISYFMNRDNCEIEPYSLGVFLGDGSFTNKNNPSITIGDKEIIEEVNKYYHYINSHTKKDNKATAYIFRKNVNFGGLLTQYGLKDKKSGNKFIPKKALLSDSEYRKRLLAGLIDTDGYLCKTQSYSITTKSKQLADDILFLIYSLGGRGSIKKIRKGIKKINFMGEYYCVSFYLGKMKLPILLKRKIRNMNAFYLSPNRTSIATEKSEPSMVYGFRIDSPSQWYIADNFIVTHNSGKSTMMIQLGKLIDKRFTLRKNVSFIPKAGELAKQFNEIPEYSFLGVDEAVRALHKYDWMTNVQQTLLKLYATERYQHKCSVIVLPRFRDLTENFRNHRVKIRIHILKRGLAVAHFRDQNEYVKDPWHMDENLTITEKSLQRKKTIGVSTEDLLKAERKTKTYWFDFEFPDLDLKVKEEYQALRIESRNRIDYDEQFRHDKRLDNARETVRKWKMTTYNLLKEKGAINNMEDMKRLYHETGNNIWTQAKEYREKKGLPPLSETIREEIMIPADDFTLPELEQTPQNPMSPPNSNIRISENGTDTSPKKAKRHK